MAKSALGGREGGTGGVLGLVVDRSVGSCDSRGLRPVWVVHATASLEESVQLASELNLCGNGFRGGHAVLAGEAECQLATEIPH